MTQILRLTRNSPALLRMGHAHLGAAAAPIRAGQTRVTRAEISALFAAELGYRGRHLRAGL